ncbi:MAG: NADH:flavin oxidoreductase [Planctomycetota bacterium]|jgi:NADPH2 dehydrogenase
MYQLTKIASLKSIAQFRSHAQRVGADIPIDDEVHTHSESSLLQPISWGSRTIGNRITVQPMEGWDGTLDGGITEPMLRRWRRFGESGAKLVWGGEAMAVRPDGRANPNQLILVDRNRDGIQQLLLALREEHRKHLGRDDDLVVGFQLTHSGRFCRPRDHHRWEGRVAHRHPLLDLRFGGVSDAQLLTASQVRELIADYIAAARLAQEIGADFVDVKCCHGYLLHEFLSAQTRDDEYGGSLENRARIVLEIIAGIRAACPGLGIGVRMSAFDTVPFEPDPSTAVEGRLGQGRPTAHNHLIPYRWGFGVNPEKPTEMDLDEPLRCIGLFKTAGVSLLNVSAGSPYYSPHLVRPAAFPPSDGYQPHEDPLLGVARHLRATRAIKERHPELIVVGSGYSYLQEYLPHAAQHAVRDGWTDCVGLGRTMLSYPRVLRDAAEGNAAARKLICRTFSDCTTAPRNGLPSGCYPLDDFYKGTPTADAVKEIKSRL